MKLKADCKINLGLDILRRREDGYHDIETVMLPVSELYDTVTVDRAGELRFVQTGIAIDCPPERNLCLRAYRLMQRRYGIPPVSIALDKRVPFGAGLGGGSSDASAVIKALDMLFGLHLSEEEAIGLAAELGSDTAFFIVDRPMLCSGRGEKMKPVAIDLDGSYLAIVKPLFGISTSEAYAGVRPCVPDRPLLDRLHDDRASWQSEVGNAFERHLFAAYPALADLKRRLLDAGAYYASMSGSGSAVFGLFDRPPRPTLPENTFVHIQAMSRTADCRSE